MKGILAAQCRRVTFDGLGLLNFRSIALEFPERRFQGFSAGEDMVVMPRPLVMAALSMPRCLLIQYADLPEVFQSNRISLAILLSKLEPVQSVRVE